MHELWEEEKEMSLDLQKIDELEEKIRRFRFELDLVEERQNQWIERVKKIEEKLHL